MKPLSKRKKILIIVLGILIVLSLNFFQKEVKGFFYSTSSPIQKSFWGARNEVSNFFGAITEMKNLKEENEEMKLKNQELLGEIVSLKELEKENQILREALGIGLEKEFRLTLAEVVGKDIGQDFILINKGSRDGMSEGMPAITQEKVLLGKIAEVYESFSRISLLTNEKSSFDVEVSNGDISGVAKGEGGLKLFLDFIPKDEEIKGGDLVISSSISGIYPKGLLVGLIKEVKKDDVRPFQQAEISPFFDLRNIKTLFVITNY